MTWWALNYLANTRSWNELYTVAGTTQDDHLYMAWAKHKPSRHAIWRNVRGKQVFCGWQYIWDTPTILEQNRPGDTPWHYFLIQQLQPEDHIWYYLYAPDGPYGREIQGPLVHIPPPEVPVPTARIWRSTDQLIQPNTLTPISFDTTRWDNAGFFDPANPTRLTALFDALYSMGGNFHITTPMDQSLDIHIRLNDGAGIGHHSHPCPAATAGGQHITIHTIWALQTADYVTLECYHTNPGPLWIDAEPLHSPDFWIAAIGPYPT